MLTGSTFFLQMYSNLAPRLGHSAYASSTVGSGDLRGGKINWGSLGSSISNAFKTTGRYLSKAASKFAKSQAFADIKKGLHDSGVVTNIAGLAGDTINSLVDIGRLKVDNELQKLRNKVLHTIPADQLAQILLNYQQTHDKFVTEPAQPAEPVIGLPAPDAIPSAPPLPPAETITPAVVVPVEESKKRSYEEDLHEAEVPASVAVHAPVVNYPTTILPYKRRFLGTGEAEWQMHLNSMLGQGVRYTSSKHCY